MKRRSLLLLVLLWTSLGSHAQQIGGIILDATDLSPLIGANIFLKSDFSKGSQTDVEGQFQLKLDKLPDTLLISYIGYEDQWVVLNATVASKAIEIGMKPQAAQIETVTVRAKKLVSKEFAVESIRKLDIYLNPSAKADALLAVQSLPSVTTPDEAANISLRGSPASETGIFLNNVPLRDVVRLDQSNGVGQFSIFNTDLIETVNVFPSNPPLEFGHATSGVVALYTDDELPDNRTGISLNLTGIGGLHSRKLSQQTAMVVYGNLMSHHGLVGVNSSSFEDLEDFRTTDAGLYLIHQFGNGTNLKFFNFSLFENYSYATRFPGYAGVYEQKKDRNLSILNLTHRKDRFQWQLNQGFSISKARYGIGALNIRTNNADYHASATTSYLGDQLTLKTGISFDSYQYQSRGTYPLYSFAYAENHPKGTFDGKRDLQLPELFVYAKRNLSTDWTVGGGFRWHPGLGDQPSYKSLQASIAYQADENHWLILSGGQYEKLRLPTSASELAVQQRSRQLSLDYRWEKDRWQGNLAFYGKQNREGQLDNLIYGAEFFIAYQSSHLSGSFSIAHIHSHLKTNEGSYPSSYDMDYYIRGMLRYRFDGGMEISTVYRLREGRYYLPVLDASPHSILDVYEPLYAAQVEGDRLPAYQVMDISCSRRFATSFGWMIAYVNISNAFDQRNIRYYSYNADYTAPKEEYLNRRTIFFGLVAQF
ncbi:MAG: TonB-dependent receptor [Bacteroidota bacterium]